MAGTLAEERVPPGEAEDVARFIAFLKEATAKRYPPGKRQRFNQARATACVDAEFRVADDLEPDHRVGLFARPVTYRAYVRFANAASLGDRERDIRGMSIRLFDVQGENLIPGSALQDFVLNSHPVMMAPDTRGFLQLLQANEAGGFQRVLYFLTHPKALRIASAARSNPTCHLDLPYWSTTPYLFGPGRAVKYIVTPSSTSRSTLPATLTDTYLAEAMRTRLQDNEATFDFMVQFQTDPERMPIEDASVEWPRDQSPYIRLAGIRIPRQAFDDPARVAQCESIAFNPWHALAAHRPLGGMNRARREIYRAMAEFRNQPAPA